MGQLEHELIKLKPNDLPAQRPDGWVQSSWWASTHYLTHYLLFPGPDGDREFADLYWKFINMRSRQPGLKRSSRTAAVKSLDPRFEILARYDATIRRSWAKGLGVLEISAPDSLRGHKRLTLDSLLVDLKMPHILPRLDARGFCAGKPYSRAEAELHRMTKPPLHLVDLDDDFYLLAWCKNHTPRASQRASDGKMQAHRILSRYARIRIYVAEQRLREAMMKTEAPEWIN